MTFDSTSMTMLALGAGGTLVVMMPRYESV